MSERVLVRLARHDRQATGIVPKDIQEYEMQCERHCKGIGNTPSFAIELTDLEPHVEYKYVVVATQTGANATLGSGTLHTWDLQTPQAQHCLSGTDCDSRASVGDTIERGQLRFASSSCVMTGRGMFERPIQVFKTIPKHNVDLFLFLGDSQYSDVPSGRHLGTNNHLYDVRYQELLNHPSFRELVQNVPVVWQYDDHEIQDNYAEGAESPVFYTAYNAWKEHLGYMNPLQSLSHTYFRDQHTCDDFDNTDESCFAEDHTVVGTLPHSRISFVQGIAAFYICDTRMFQNEEDSTMIGKEQLEDVLDWICEPLPKDVAVKFLVSPQPWTLNYLSGWSMYPEERSRVLDRIEECHMIGKVILISGDQHRPAVYVVRENLIEISVSPVDATASAIQGLDHRTVQHDKVLLEAKGFTEAFALFDIIQDNGGDTTVKVTVVAGGKDFGVESIEYILASIATFVFCIWFARSCPGDCSLLWLGALFLGGELLIHVTAKYELETVFQLDIPILR